MDKRNEELFVEGINKFQIVKTDGTFNADKDEIIPYGYNFLLKSYNDSRYIQRCIKGHHDNVRDMEIHKTVRFGLCLTEFDDDMIYKQSTQFDINDGDKIVENVFYDGNEIGITFGGNYPIKTSLDHKDPHNNWRT